MPVNRTFHTVVIIGNGFDINLGFNTAYSKFINSDFFKNLVHAGNYAAKLLQIEQGLKQWIDVENYLVPISKAYPKSADFYADFLALSSALKAYLGTIDFSTYERTSKAFSLIQELKANNLAHIFIDFNYSKSLQYILSELNKSDESTTKNLLKIHGSLEQTDIVFGIQDSADILPEHIFLKKSVHNFYNGGDVQFLLSKAQRVIFFGHSIGQTDHSYFEDYFENILDTPASLHRKPILDLYHYTEQGRLDLMSQLDKLTSQKIGLLKSKVNLRSFETFK